MTQDPYTDLTRSIAWGRIFGDMSARTAAAMLSDLSKRESRGEECPSYKDLLNEHKEAA